MLVSAMDFKSRILNATKYRVSKNSAFAFGWATMHSKIKKFIYISMFPKMLPNDVRGVAINLKNLLEYLDNI